MTIDIRPHHLLCILTYAGKGYSEEFTRNYGRIVARLNAGETVSIVEGPDEICAPLVDAEAEPHCLRESVTRRDADASASLARLLRRPIAVGDEILLDVPTTAALRDAFASGTVRKACDGCQWSRLCCSIARRGFRDAFLIGHAAPEPTPDQSKERE
ncbi:DUF1284 domain-containing protein [Stappia stellulata]|uniref:DUF1284 domain-containing protein n=1 Tax=Stappia stellulata TaxID=71235 RepID=UPI0004132B78|nr:DUF1284 domain-containing protein [Stappia stellulata]